VTPDQADHIIAALRVIAMVLVGVFFVDFVRMLLGR